MRGIMFNSIFNFARAAVLGAVLGAVCLPAAAADADPAQMDRLQKKLDESIQMIQALATRVKELEATQARAQVASAAPPPATAPTAAAAVSPTPAQDEQRLSAVEQQVTQIEAANASRHGDDTGLPIHGFADVGVGNYNPYFANLKGGNIGSLDLYLTPQIGHQVLALAELIFEVGPSGEVGTDLERFQLGYQFSDAATVWIGRFHTPYGYVNTALHHGVWLADALRRPKFANFEDHGGILPSHTVGAWLTGAQREGPGKFLYDFYVGNGQQLQNGIVDMQSGGNDHGAAMAGSRLSYAWTGGAIDGLTVGINGFTDKVDSQQTLNLTRVDMMGAYAVYDTDMWEHIIEAYSFHDTNLYGDFGSHNSNAWFGQFAYRAGWGVPYVRYERADLDQRDTYFAEQQFGASYYRSALGVRFDINSKSAIKFEVASTHTTDYRQQDISYGLPEDYKEILAQYAIRF
jgi:hypothetical protein